MPRKADQQDSELLISLWDPSSAPISDSNDSGTSTAALFDMADLFGGPPQAFSAAIQVPQPDSIHGLGNMSISNVSPMNNISMSNQSQMEPVSPIPLFSASSSQPNAVSSSSVSDVTLQSNFTSTPPTTSTPNLSQPQSAEPRSSNATAEYTAVDSTDPNSLSTRQQRKMTSEELDNANPQTTGDGKPRKHIRRACLECRKRHIRCDGVLPICRKCEDNGRTCEYVPSHRGGLRVPKGKKNQDKATEDCPKKPHAFASPCMLDAISVTIGRDSDSTAAGNHTRDGRVAQSSVLKPSSIEAPNQQFKNHTPHSEPIQQVVLTPQAAIKDVEITAAFRQSHPQPKKVSPASRPLPAKSSLNTSQPSYSSDLSDPTNPFTPSPDLSSGETFLHHSSNISEMADTPNSGPGSYTHPSSNGVDPRDFSLDEIISIYYSSFHNRHPILPSKDKIRSYLKSIRPVVLSSDHSLASSDPRHSNELVMAMAYISHVFTLTKPPVLEDLQARIQRVYDAVQCAPNDIVKIQASLILFYGAHLATENAISLALRNWLFGFLYSKLSAYNLSSPVSDVDNFSPSSQNIDSDSIGGNFNVPIELFKSARIRDIDTKIAQDAVSKCVHEAFFLEVFLALIGRTPLSRFAQPGVVDSVPISNVPGFAYSARFRTVKVARSILQTLGTVGSGLQFSTEFSRLEALITTFQGFLSGHGGSSYLGHATSSRSRGEPMPFPALVNDFGQVDDGIHQAIMVINFSAILLHFPFSNLYQNRLPSYVQCMDSSGPILPSQQPPRNKYRTTMSTRKCVEAANTLVQIIPDIGAQQVSNRTPTYSCTLSMAMLVHMKAYHWLVTSFNSPTGLLSKETVQRLTGAANINISWDSFEDPEPRRPGTQRAKNTVEAENEAIRQSEIKLYEEYLKLSINTLKMFSQRWVLPGKLNRNLCNVMYAVLPELYESTVENRPRQKRKTSLHSEDGENSVPPRKKRVLEKDCWMKNLDLQAVNNLRGTPSFDGSSSTTGATPASENGTSLNPGSTGMPSGALSQPLIDDYMSQSAMGALDASGIMPQDTISLDDIPSELGLDIFDPLFDLDNLARKNLF